MMDGPLLIAKFIKIKTATEMSKDEIRYWVLCLRKTLPSGIMCSTQTTDNKGRLKNVSLIKRKFGKVGFEYVVPLTRDIVEREAEQAVEKFTEKYPKIEFEIELSQAVIQPKKLPDIVIPNEKLMGLCSAWAKKQHDIWLKDRIDNGWTYGVAVDMKGKKHPLIRQWHELPDKFKKVDTEQPQQLLDLFHEHGYVVVLRSDLDK